jgi:hypothetical protein
VALACASSIPPVCNRHNRHRAHASAPRPRQAGREALGACRFRRARQAAANNPQVQPPPCRGLAQARACVRVNREGSSHHWSLPSPGLARFTVRLAAPLWHLHDLQSLAQQAAALPQRGSVRASSLPLALVCGVTSLFVSSRACAPSHVAQAAGRIEHLRIDDFKQGPPLLPRRGLRQLCPLQSCPTRHGHPPTPRHPPPRQQQRLRHGTGSICRRMPALCRQRVARACTGNGVGRCASSSSLCPLLSPCCLRTRSMACQLSPAITTHNPSPYSHDTSRAHAVGHRAHSLVAGRSRLVVEHSLGL